MNKGISIIIPCFNAGNYLIEMVQSIIHLKHTIPMEIIVIDDGSTTDETKNALSVVSEQKNVQVIRNAKNLGTQMSRNTGLAVAKYQYVMTCDADDRFDTNINGTSYMSKAVNFLNKHPEYAFAYCTSKMFGDFVGLTISAYPVTAKQILMKHHAQQIIIYRKEDIPECGYDIDIKKWTDWSFAVSLLNSRYKKGLENKIKFFDIPFHNYRIHSSPTRMSVQSHSEKDMVELTVKKNSEIYKELFPGENLDTIVEKVYRNKPNRLVDLLHIARYDFDRAVAIAIERSADISSLTPDSVP